MPLKAPFTTYVTLVAAGALPAGAAALRGRGAQPLGPLHAQPLLRPGPGFGGELYVRRAAQAGGL